MFATADKSKTKPKATSKISTLNKPIVAKVSKTNRLYTTSAIEYLVSAKDYKIFGYC